MTKGIFIDGITKEELHDMVSGKWEIPDILINAKQAQEILTCDYKTLMQYVSEDLIPNYGYKRPMFRLRDTVDLLKDNPKYKRFRNLA